MNKLPTSKRVMILSMLVEGMSMRSISRTLGVSINTVTKMLVDAGEACAAYHDEAVRGIRGHRRVECDEIWSFAYAKERAVRHAKAAPEGAGDAWTFTAIDADAKLIVSYLVSGARDGESALAFMDDLRGRLDDSPQISTDGLSAYLGAVEGAFGGDVDFAQVIKAYGKEPGEDNERRYSPPVCTDIEKRRIEGNPHLRKANTSYVRMGMRRFTRLTNGFSKRAAQPHHADGDAPLHATDQRIQQARRETHRHAEPVFRPLQFLPDSQVAEGHPGDGSWLGERTSGHGMDRRPD